MKGMSKDLEKIINLIRLHNDEKFFYQNSIQLFRAFNQLEQVKIFHASIKGKTVGCVYGMDYMYNNGWIGALLVHKKYRKMGIGKYLVRKTLEFLNGKNIFLCVLSENLAAKKLFENFGFKAIYRRYNLEFDYQLKEIKSNKNDVTNKVNWNELRNTISFKKRDGIVNMGFYPIKLNNRIFEDLKKNEKIIKYGKILAVVEKSYYVQLDGEKFILNEYLLEKLSLSKSKEIIYEINPFFIDPSLEDLVGLINLYLSKGKVKIWTYENDSLTKGLPLGSLGAMLMNKKQQ